MLLTEAAKARRQEILIGTAELEAERLQFLQEMQKVFFGCSKHIDNEIRSIEGVDNIFYWDLLVSDSLERNTWDGGYKFHMYFKYAENSYIFCKYPIYYVTDKAEFIPVIMKEVREKKLLREVSEGKLIINNLNFGYILPENGPKGWNCTDTESGEIINVRIDNEPMKYVWVDNPTDSLRWTQNVRYFEGTFLDTYVYADPKIRNDAAAVQLLAA